MFATRRLLLLGLIVLGSQIATGCCYYRPILPSLRYCGPGAPLLNRPLLAPAVSGPAYSGPVTGPVCDIGYSGAPTSGSMPTYGGYSGVPISGPAYGSGGCTSCGGGGFGGIPIASAPSGIPIAATQPGSGYPTYPTYPMTGAAPAGYVNPNASVPLHMPSAMPGGVPFDSSLAPTVKPPVGTSPVIDSKKLATAGK